MRAHDMGLRDSGLRDFVFGVQGSRLSYRK